MIGVWLAPAPFLTSTIAEQRTAFARIEELGYHSLWTGEPAPAAATVAPAREIFSHHAIALAATDRLVVGSGIANVAARGPATMRGAAATLAEAFPGRYVLGLGGAAGPSALRAYLDEFDAVPLLPDVRYPRVLAALGPKALGLAAERADGVHPFLQPVAHTRVARDAVGPGALVVPHQAAVLETDPDAARARLRAVFGRMPAADNPYVRSYRRLGYGDDDLVAGYSDRLVDDLLAWGDEAAIAARLHAHREAGADEVLVQPFAESLSDVLRVLERLAGELFGR
ncbi:TIGR03620 family F420-dependent LLM class oxidoreductase [Cryptosporangium arvum]|uniref:Putative F420-dependent oxidoreductase n=1 Tax=Cryptosporangium arvum DSM 44712 TaxID=927661 RepID=A0A010ZPR6_9ACTN|nr:TIGR03620 family F420-dependent LLM class oxidoreductase [Cryptosporangium arvum]EXG80669.1 putative F420-dependent oxidoreductase [Cryptosporangium arvum DSM 44712]